MKKIIFLLFILFFYLVSLNSKAQNNLDSLQNILNTQDLPEDTQIQILLKLAKKYPTTSDSSLPLYRKALSLARKANDQKQIAHISGTIGGLENAPFDSLVFYTKMSLDAAYDIKDQKTVAAAYLALSYHYSMHRGSETDFGKQTMRDSCIAFIDSAKLRYEALKDTHGIIYTLHRKAEVFMNIDSIQLGLYQLDEARKLVELVGDSMELEAVDAMEGMANFQMGNFEEALPNFERTLKVSIREDVKPGIAFWKGMIALTLVELERYEEANEMALSAYKLSKDNNLSKEIIDNLRMLYEIYKKQHLYKEALKYHEMLTETIDSMYAVKLEESVSQLNLKLQTVKDQQKIALLQKDREIQEQVKNRQLIGLFSAAIGLILLILLAISIYRGKKRSDGLLLNILPEEVAEELKEKGHSDAQLIDQVTVLFTDFKGFTALSEQVTPKELVKDLHECFSAFDSICEKYGIEKIKTIGDAYMAAGGLPSPNITHAQDVVNAALEMAEVIEKGKAKKIAQGLPFFEIRIGVHTGPVVAGIVGVKKFQYDIWGDTVNTASRMESSGEVGKVNVSEATYNYLKDDSDFFFESRGKINAKGKGEIEMYFVSLV